MFEFDEWRLYYLLTIDLMLAVGKNLHDEHLDSLRLHIKRISKSLAHITFTRQFKIMLVAEWERMFWCLGQPHAQLLLEMG